MFTANADSVLAILAAFAPSLGVVSPFVPVPILAVALLVMSRAAEPFPVPVGTVTAIRRNRQRATLNRPGLAVVTVAFGLVLVATAAFARFPA